MTEVYVNRPTAKAKYGGLSVTAAKCAASGRDDGIFDEGE
jgi:hypothetical protein